MAIVNSLKRFRQEFNLSQKAVADKLGIKQQSYSAYESSKNPVTPSVTLIISLAKAYNVSADYLLGLSDEPQPAAATSDKPPPTGDEATQAAIALVNALRHEIKEALEGEADLRF